MQSSSPGSFRLFRLFGIDVFLHWSWFIVALIQYRWGSGRFDNATWHLLTYVSLFGIVLLHEFGHSLACKSVGGQANRIILWPLGGIAFVRPPARPGAVLWSIAAGPLVNVALIPVTLVPAILVTMAHQGASPPPYTDLERYIELLGFINAALLIFNLLPIYPLDGGQILQSLLWFAIGRSASLRIAAGIGVVVALLGGGFALTRGNYWLVILAVFIGMQAFNGLRAARFLADREAEVYMTPIEAITPPEQHPWNQDKDITR